MQHKYFATFACPSHLIYWVSGTMLTCKKQERAAQRTYMLNC